MTGGLQPFVIGELKTGISTYLQPWRRAEDAFDPLVNAYVYRGTLNKRNGYIVFGNQLADHNPVMGIMQRINESTGVISLVVASTRNAYKYNVGPNTFTLIGTIGGDASIFLHQTVTNSTGAPIPVNVPPTGTAPTFWENLVPSTSSPAVPILITAKDLITGTTVGTIADNGTILTGGTGIFTGNNGTINYTTGVVSMVVTVPAHTTYDLSLNLAATTTGGYFSGNNTNFFNWTNWQPTDPTTFATSTSYLYMTNDVDPITLYDGTNLSRPILYVDKAGTDYITTALDVKVYKNRLLAIRPTLNSTSNALNQSIYYSALFNPLNFINDVAGNGGQLTAATGDIILATEFLRDAIIVFFTFSTWIFRYTGYDVNPYRFDKINNSKTNSVPYGTVAFDERVTSLGSTGFIACDGANVQRYDISIIDYYETNMSEQYYNQCFAQRYDNLNQAWLLYVSNGADPTTFPIVGGGAPGSDSALIYNFLENSWATYTFSIPMQSMGLFFSQMGQTWASTPFAWDTQDTAWKAYTTQKFAPILLIGDTTGNVYWIDNETANTDNGNPIVTDIVSTQWNPIVNAGQKVQFPYIDVYYQTVSTDPTNPIQLNLNFYVNNSNYIAESRPLTLDGPSENVTNIIGTGNGTSSYAGTIVSSGYIYPNTFTISTITSAGIEDFADNGNGLLIGSLGDTGTINYNTTAWTLALTPDIPTGNPITANYQFSNPNGFNWKRIYINLIGQFIQMEIDPTENAPFKILGFILWAKPAGRLTP